MAISRTLYSTQFLNLFLNETGAASIDGLPIQSASIERTIPTEDVMILGKLGSAGRQQKEVESVKMDIKLFWASGSRANSSTNVVSAGGDETRITASDLQTLTGNALRGIRSKIIVQPNGFTGYGVLTNFGIDGSVGDFLTASMSFEGFGTPIIASSTTDPTVESSYVPASVFVYTSENISLGAGHGTETIKSAKFSLDIPTERISHLGAPVTGLQTDATLTGAHLLVAKPPFKVSVSYEGQLVTGAHELDALTFGHISFTPIAANITSQNYSQNAGDVGASMSFSAEGTSVTIAAV
jgi:hypothetical protein